MVVRIWIDDVRKMPVSFDKHILTVNDARAYLQKLADDAVAGGEPITVVLDLDHDAGDCALCGGDYIRLLDWLEATGFVENHPALHFVFAIHSANPVGRANMERVIRRNRWEMRR